MQDYVILASGSPRRKELLKMIFDSFETRVSDCNEVITSSEPSEITKELAYQKANSVMREVLKEQENTAEKSILVIGADTIVSFQGRIFGKPKDKREAFEMLSVLREKVHEVTTGVALLRGGKKEESVCFAETTKVSVAAMSEEEIWQYIATGDPFDKAGAYGIQGVFAKYIEGIEGDYFNVVGLPVHRIYASLRN